MKKIKIRKIEIRNFKATASQVVDLPPGGIVVSGYNGIGKSSLLEAVMFTLGASVEAQRVINQTTKAPASVSLTIEHPDGLDTFTRTLTPTLDANGKVTASTSSYVISGVPCKKTEYDICVNQLFGTKDWIYLLNPSLAAQNKSNRNLLLAVAGCPTEKEFLQSSNPGLAEKIGNTDFADFEKREKAIIQELGKKIDAIPGRIEENAAMIQQLPEPLDEAPIHARIAEIREVLKGVDQTNAERADQYNKVACEAQDLRNEAIRLHELANERVMEENKRINQSVFDAELALQNWQSEKAKLTARYDAIKSDIAAARTDLARAEARAQELYAEAMQHAEAHKQTSLRQIDSEKLGHCTSCNKWCSDLASIGVAGAEKQRTDELARIVEAGKQVMALRGKELARINEITDRIDSLVSKEHEIEKQLAEMPPIPVVPARQVVESTPESLALIKEAEAMEATAKQLIKENRLEIMQRPTELVEELQQLNETLTRGAATAQTQKNNDKINARIEELRQEESALITTQLQHKQHLAMLAQFHKDYANEVTGKCNDIFKDTEYSVILFAENMGNERGSATFLASKNGSTNLSTAENIIFWKLFTERVLSLHFGVMAPILIDNGECVSDETKFGSLHQKIIACVDKCDLTIIPLTMPSLKDGYVATFENK